MLSYGDPLLAGWELLTDDAEHAEAMVLTACRIWRFHEEQAYCSKSASGAGALGRDGSLRAVPAGLEQHNLGPDAPIEPPEIARLLALVRTRLRERLPPGKDVE